MFLVTCGATEKPFTISADDQKMKHDWMLAIRKVGVASENGLHLRHTGEKSFKSEVKNFCRCLKFFYTLKIIQLVHHFFSPPLSLCLSLSGHSAGKGG